MAQTTADEISIEDNSMKYDTEDSWRVSFKDAQDIGVAPDPSGKMKVWNPYKSTSEYMPNPEGIENKVVAKVHAASVWEQNGVEIDASAVKDELI